MSDKTTNITDAKPQQRNLNQRIEDLVLAMERVEQLADKKFSARAAFWRGVMQGLGIVVGSTIVAGILYTVLVRFISPQLIQQLMLDNAVERSLQHDN